MRAWEKEARLLAINLCVQRASPSGRSDEPQDSLRHAESTPYFDCGLAVLPIFGLPSTSSGATRRTLLETRLTICKIPYKLK